MGGPVRATTPGGEEIVMVPAAEYDRLVEELEDWRDSQIAVAAHARLMAGEETISSEEMDALLAAPTPLAFWRAHRGFTTQAFADQTGVSATDVETIESGARPLSPELARRFADELRLEVEDLVPGD